jgi:hypothetical protein
MARTNRTGRTKGTDKFVMLTEDLLRTAAYRSLSANARALLVELIRRFNGSNNGYISMSVREAAKLCGYSARPAMKALKDLRGRGFIKSRMKGSFDRKVRHASEWELTFHPVGNSIPTHDYLKWKPSEAVERNKSRCAIRQQTGVLHDKR